MRTYGVPNCATSNRGGALSSVRHSAKLSTFVSRGVLPRMRAGLVLLSVFAACAVLSSAQVTSVYSASDRKGAVDAAKALLVRASRQISVANPCLRRAIFSPRFCCCLLAAVSLALLFSQNKKSVAPRDAYLASVILADGASAGSIPSAACESLEAVVGDSAASLLDVSYALRAMNTIGCLKSVSAATVSRVQAGLDSANIADVFGAVKALPVLAANKQELTVSWASIVDAVADLAEVRWTFTVPLACNPATMPWQLALPVVHSHAMLASLFRCLNIEESLSVMCFRWCDGTFIHCMTVNWC